MGSESSKPQENGSVKKTKMRKYVEEIEDLESLQKDGQESEGGENTDDLGRIASDPNPERLRKAFEGQDHHLDEHDFSALSINPMNLQYPFENIILEGGGNKGIAYVGVIRCLEDLQIMKQIKRVGGTSAGAMTAALVALGYTSEDIYLFLSSDLREIFLDHSCGYLSLIPNLLKNYGWNPGKKIHDWFGIVIKNKTGNPDTTFQELYKSTGMELCVVVTNLNLKTAQYLHPKTAPNMAIRDALRMTMSIPGIFSAIHYDSHSGQPDIYVDGGLLVNYPINCFDGWFLSMEKEDSFLYKLKSLKDLPKLMTSNTRFTSKGENKTIGFLLFDDAETEVMRFDLERRIGTLLPEKPKVRTEHFRKAEKKKKIKQQAQREHIKVVNAVDSFLEVLHKHNIDDDQEFITEDELKAALMDDGFPKDKQEILFGKDFHHDKVFEILDKDGNGQIVFSELLQFIEERGIRMQNRVQGYSRDDIHNFGNYLLALQETMLTNLKQICVTDEDKDRSVGINTGHVTTNDYVLKDADREFAVERGYNATMSFLRYYAVHHPTSVKERPQTN